MSAPQDQLAQAFPPWHEAVWERLLGALLGGRLAHAVLIHGQAGSGKRRLARRLLNAVLCESPAAGRLGGGCGECRSCHLFGVGSHPGAWTLEPEEVGGVIVIERIRDLVTRVGLTTQVGAAKGAIVAPAEAMNRAAANALLKTLEEPPGATHFVLVSDAPSVLPRTVRSRCQAFSVPTPGREEGVRWLTEHAPDAVAVLDEADLAPFAAIRLAEEGAAIGIGKVRTVVLDLILGRREPVDAVARLRRECDPELVVRTMLRYVHQLVRLKFGQPVPFTAEEQEVLTRRAGGLEFQALYDLSDRITRARRDLGSSTGFSEQLLLEDLAVRWAGMGRGAGR